jgi:hypothetical protein
VSRAPVTLRDVKEALRAGPYAWPGGYPLYMVTSDGAALSFEAVRERFREVCADMLDMSHLSQWRIVAIEANWEDGALTCDHTGKRIPSAYADDDA